MAKRKRIKALPVCSVTLREKCAMLQACRFKTCIENRTCAALELIEQHYNNQKIELANCLCAKNQFSGHGCPYFRKAVDK